jgi:hypothetical protein
MFLPALLLFSRPGRLSGGFFRDGVDISRKVKPGVLTVLRKRLTFSALRNQGCSILSSLD